MSTGTKIVQSALQKIGAHTAVKQANPTSLENGRNKLNSYIADLQDQDIEFGAVPIEALGDELSEPLGLTNAIEDNLAILLQPDHPGSEISGQLRVNAAVGFNKMKGRYKTRTIPKQVVRSTLPKGAGNRGFNQSDAFFNEGDTLG